MMIYSFKDNNVNKEQGQIAPREALPRVKHTYIKT